MKAIPTTYKGIIFRSRLEASWAAYFDYLGLNWAYEPEGYALAGGVHYLPDFYFKQRCEYNCELFGECKPPSQNSLRKAGLFVREMRRGLLLAMPEGRFFICTPRYADLLINDDWSAIERHMQVLPSLAMVSDEAVTGPYNYFWNGGAVSDGYVGHAPDYFDAVSDRNRANGGDARCYYYGGLSTWGQRGFAPPRWVAKARIKRPAASLRQVHHFARSSPFPAAP